MKVTNLLFFMFLSIAGLLVSGCATGRVDLSESGNLKVEIVDLKNKYVSNVKVYQEDHLFVIFGKVNRRNKKLPGSGHVDIVLTGPDGNVITKSFLPYTSSKKFKNRTWNFHTKLHLTPPEGSTIRIVVAN